MEIFLLIMAALVVVIVIGRLKGDLDIERLDVAGLKREIWVTQNWINNYYKGDQPVKYQEKFQYKLSRLEQANARLKKLTSCQASRSVAITNNRPKEIESVVSAEIIEDSEEFKNFLIVDSIRQLTDLALSQGVIESQDKARKYWESFKSRILFFHLNQKSATLDEVKLAIEEELGPVFKRSKFYIDEGMPEELALSKSIVEWYKQNNALVQHYQSDKSKNGNTLSEEEIDASISNTARVLDFDISWILNETALRAEQGNVDAQCQLAEAFYQGKWIGQDFTMAVKWYQMAMDQGFSFASVKPERRRPTLLPGLMLGRMYYSGDGVPQDYVEAAKWYKLAAEQGVTDAQFELGEMYEGGKGVPQDYIEAVKWYRMAAEKDDAYAQEKLGEMYEEGKGVSQDQDLAQMWYDKSQNEH